MRFLFDQNLSPGLVDTLADAYPSSNHVFLLGLDQSSDVEVWEYARGHGFTIVTKDSDLSEISLVRGFPPSIVWIRKGNCSTAQIEQILRNHANDLQELEAMEPGGVLVLY